jgi:chaperonin cofactor prefoldin
MKKTDTDRIAELRKKIDALEKQMEEVQKEYRKFKVKAG